MGTILAAMHARGSDDWMDNHMGGGSGWWWVMGIGWLVLLAAVVVVVVLLTRRPGNQDGRGAARSAEDVLADRFAWVRSTRPSSTGRRDALRS